MARRAHALAPVLVALVLSAAACDLGEPDGAEGDPTPVATDPSSGPAGPGDTNGETPAPHCPEVEDVTVAWPGGGPAGDRPVQIVPRCDELEVPVPFTVPTEDQQPRSV